MSSTLRRGPASRPLLRALSTVAAAACLLLCAQGPALASSPAAALAWSPTTLTGIYDYGRVDAVTGQQVARTFTLTNRGGRAPGVIRVALSGASAFTTVEDHCSGTSLGPASFCTITVIYSPVQTHESDSATLSAQTRDGDASLALTGNSGPTTFLEITTPVYTCLSPVGCWGQLDGSGLDPDGEVDWTIHGSGQIDALLVPSGTVSLQLFIPCGAGYVQADAFSFGPSSPTVLSATASTPCG